MAARSGSQVFIEAARRNPPRVALVLGSGLYGLTRRIHRLDSLNYADVPDLAVPSVAGHRGRLTLGTWAGQRLLVFEGRLHLYEGHPARSVAATARIARELGAEIFLASNSAGGIADSLAPPCLLAVSDHIDWTRPDPWREPGPGGLNPGRPSPYAARLVEQLQQSARELGMSLPTGTYAQVTGPNYETPAEIHALHAWGADVVGMSTVIEIAAAHELGLQCAAISAVTNRGAGRADHPLQHQEVLANAAALEQPLGQLLERFLQRL